MNMQAARRPTPQSDIPDVIPGANDTPIRAVLFDLDDTLWPIVPTLVAAEKLLHEWLQLHAPSVAAAHSIESLRERRQALMASDARYRIDLMALRAAVMAEVFEACGEDPAKIAAGMALFGAARNRVTPFDDVLPALARLGGKVLLGSISNGAADLAAIGMAQHFRISVAARDFGSAKPDPEIFRHACRALGVAPAEAVYVGDDPLLDVMGAQRAGMRTVWINRFGRALPPEIRPDAVCTTLDQLEAWLGLACAAMTPAQGA
jgi:HAD superfamily hydrolase (TIGR01509 family)